MLQIVASKAAAETQTKQEGTTDDIVAAAPWLSCYVTRPTTAVSLFDLERMTAVRMELLADVDMMMNSPKYKSTKEVTEVLAGLVRRVGRQSAAESDSLVDLLSMTPEEDAISHWLCRIAFCVSERWRTWFVRVEETLMKARFEALKLQNKLPCALKVNELPCQVPDANDPNVKSFGDWLARRNDRNENASYQDDDFYYVPISHVLKLVKDRHVLLVNGRALLHRTEAFAIYLNDFKGKLFRGLNDALRMREKLLPEEDRTTVTSMLDAFLARFVAEPSDKLAQSAEGVVGYADVERLARSHFPLCMKNIDEHLRHKGHVKHSGRLQYGLFLKSIGLSMEDALKLFSTLMTVKGGGSVEAFAKSAYGYNVRHNYGKEGKRTSYTSLSCAKILAAAPMLDAFDCHGCPFRFTDEAKLRAMLNEERSSLFAPPGGVRQRINNTDIEDIIQDSKEMHYTRACYKYFTAVHLHQIPRDNLFRSPFEYYTASVEGLKAWKAKQDTAQNTPSKRDASEPATAGGSAKRTRFATPDDHTDKKARADSEAGGAAA